MYFHGCNIVSLRVRVATQAHWCDWCDTLWTRCCLIQIGLWRDAFSSVKSVDNLDKYRGTKTQKKLIQNQYLIRIDTFTCLWICIYNAYRAFVAMELESRGSASVDKLSWPHCIKVIFSQMRMSGKIQKTGIKLGKRSEADCSGVTPTQTCIK